MAGRPPSWTPFKHISWARDYQYTDDGRIRDSSRNVLRERGPEFEVVMRIADTTRRVQFSKSSILAFEYFGTPPHIDCVVCGKRFYDHVAHLNGDRRDCSRNNLKYVTSLIAGAHEFRCLKWAMVHNEIPPYKKTVSTRVLQQRRQQKQHNGDVDWDWGPTWEVIPLLGINEGPRKTLGANKRPKDCEKS